MSFIVGVDEVLYEAFTPPDIRQVLAELPPIVPPSGNKRLIWSMVARPVLAGSLLVVIIIVTFKYDCSFL